MALLDIVGSQPVGKSPRQCPAHTDSEPSLSITVGTKVPTVLRCHAGCEWREILASLGLDGRAAYEAPILSPERHAQFRCKGLTFPKLETNGSDGLRSYIHEAWHRYGDRVLERRRHPVTGAKTLIWWHEVDDGEGVYKQLGLKGKQLHELPLYGEPEIRAAVAMGEPVLLVESESSADALMRAGLYATTWAGSATSLVPVQALSKVLGGYERLIYIPDMDEAGVKRAVDLRNTGFAPHVICGQMGEDARDLLKRIGKEELQRLIERELK